MENLQEIQELDILITDAEIYTQNPNRDVIKKGVIGIKNGKIALIDQKDPACFSAKKTINALGKIVFPGMINTHVHMFQSLLKGLGADLDLISWIHAVTAPYGVKINHKLQELSTKLSSLESIKSGCTTISEFSYTQHDPELANIAIKAMQDCAIRGVFIRTFQDCGQERGVPDAFIEDISTALNETDKLINQYHKKGDDMINIWCGPCVSWATTINAYKQTIEYCKDKKIHYSMHTLETSDDNNSCLKKYGKKLVPFLDEIGFLTPDFLAVHCVNLSEQEIDIFKNYDVKISYNPVSNMYLGSGIAPVPEMLKKQLAVSLGTDGAASNNTSDLIETLKIGALIQKAGNMDAAIISAQDMLNMATIDGAKALHLEKEIGSLEEGKKADLFIFNPDYLRSTPLHNALSTLVYSSGSENIETTIINGKIVYHNGAFLNGIDEQALISEIKQEVKTLVLDKA